MANVIPGLAAAGAGLIPKMKLLGVNGRKFSADRICREVRQSLGRKEPLEILAENGDFYQLFHLQYSGGARYPVLRRDDRRPELLSAIVAPQAAAAGD